MSGAQTFSLSYQRNAPLKTSNQLKTRLRLDTCTCLPSQPSPNCGSPSLMADSANATTDTAVPIIKHTHTFRWNETHRVFRADKKEQQIRSPAQQECTFMFRLLLAAEYWARPLLLPCVSRLRPTAMTKFGQTKFGQIQVSSLAKTKFGQTKFGQDQVWPNQVWPRPNLAKPLLLLWWWCCCVVVVVVVVVVVLCDVCCCPNLKPWTLNPKP